MEEEIEMEVFVRPHRHLNVLGPGKMVSFSLSLTMKYIACS